jgi:TonB family protein
MSDYTNDIRRYHNGEMTPAEMHALEKQALFDPFLADALEGLTELSREEFTEDDENLERKIRESIFSQPVSVAASASPAMSAGATIASVTMVPQKNAKWKWALRIAAGLAFIIVSFFTIREFTVVEPGQLAMEQPTAKNQAGPADSIATEALQPEVTQPSTGGATRSRDIASSSPQPTQGELKPKAETREVTVETEEQADVALATEPVVVEAKPTVEAKPEETALPAVKTEGIAVEDVKEEAAKLDTRDEDDKLKKVSGLAGAERSDNISRAIRGRVTSADDGSGLPGVNVVIKGSSKGTVTDSQGYFQVQSDEEKPSLIFSFIGLQSMEINAGDRQVVDVAMSSDAAQLSEVVVTGYGVSSSGPDTPTVELAHPESGNRAFKQYLQSSLRYPEEALAKKIEGRVTVEFFVEPDGSLADFMIIKGLGSGCDEELIRLIKQGPAWNPTKKDDQPMRDKVRVRLKFELPKK